MKNEEIICYCSNVTKAQIIKAMEQGARTLNDIRKMTGACTLHRCKELSPKGTWCSSDIREVMVEYMLEKKKKENNDWE